MKSLHIRLSVVLLSILLLFGAFSLWIAERSARAYFLEYTQQLNAPIAMYMAQTAELVTDGAVNTEALAELAEHIMIVNPSVELYLLDVDGVVVAQAAAANRIARTQVDLQPVMRFIEDDSPAFAQRVPVLGDNPLNVDEKRAFSAHPLTQDDQIVGYVYAVLAGRQHESLLRSIGESYSVRHLTMILAGVLVLAGLGGFVVFFTLTRRLRNLTERVLSSHTASAVLASDRASVARQAMPAHTHTGDEIEQLIAAYDGMAQQLQEQYQELQRKDSTRRELMANISHDLRTPLTTLQGYLETVLLKHRELDADLERKYLNIAHRHGDRLNSLVAQLFELSKLDSGDITLHRERFSLLELAHDALQDIDMRAKERSVKLAVTTADNSLVAYDVFADISLIHRVLENLLDNALRHTPDNGEITLSMAVTSNATVRVVVSDTGCGMSAVDAEKVFEPRVTSAGHQKDERQHAGLGLAIVSSIMALHDTTISVDTQLGQGSRFQFELPLVRSGQPALISNAARIKACV